MTTRQLVQPFTGIELGLNEWSNVITIVTGAGGGEALKLMGRQLSTGDV
jgi:hypothetical protein